MFPEIRSRIVKLIHQWRTWRALHWYGVEVIYREESVIMDAREIH